MKKIITTAAIMFCLTNTNAQYHRIEVDTIEILTYDSLGNEYHSNPPRYLIRKTEIGDIEYWKSKERNHIWNIVGIGILIIGTLAFSALK
jgi:hypothetical protein